MVKVEVSGRNIVISWIIAIAVIIYFAFVFGLIGGPPAKDEQKNYSLNYNVARCETSIEHSYDDLCWQWLGEDKEKACKENPNYDICSNRDYRLQKIN